MQLTHGACDMFWQTSCMVWYGLVWIGKGIMDFISGFFSDFRAQKEGQPRWCAWQYTRQKAIVGPVF
jgi:hypothetical protein